MENLMSRITNWEECDVFVQEFINSMTTKDWESVYKLVKDACKYGNEEISQKMPIMIVGEHECKLLTRLVEDTEVREVIIGFVAKLLVRIDITTGMPKNIPEYDNESKELHNFKQYENTFSFNKIYHFVEMTERGIGTAPDIPIEVAKRICIPKMKIEDLLEVLKNKKLMGIIWIIDSMTLDQIAQLLCESNITEYVCFECLRKLIYSQKEVEEVAVFLPEIETGIKKLVDNIVAWREVLTFYMGFPSRSPLFFMAMGNVMSDLSRDALLEIAERIVLNDSDRAEETAILSDCFQRAETSKTSCEVNNAMKRVYERWLAFVEGKHESLLDIVKTRAWGIVNLYVRNNFSEDERNKLVAEEQDSLDQLGQEWFASKSEMQIEYYRRLTKLRLFQGNETDTF